MPRRPVHHLRTFHYNDIDGVMEGDRQSVDTYQGAGPATPGSPPINININLGEILQGLGLGEMMQTILSRAGKVTESELPKIKRSKLVEAVTRGANAGDVLDLMTYLERVGAIK